MDARAYTGKSGCTFLAERLHRAGLVISDVEDGVQLGDLQQVMNFLGQVEQFEFSTLVANRGEGADQLTNPRAIYIGHFAQIQAESFFGPLTAAHALCHAGSRCLRRA